MSAIHRPFATMGTLMAAAADSEHVPASQRAIRAVAFGGEPAPAPTVPNEVDIDTDRQAAVLAAMRTNPHLAKFMSMCGLRASDVIAHGPRALPCMDKAHFEQLCAETKAREAGEKKVGR